MGRKTVIAELNGEEKEFTMAQLESLGTDGKVYGDGWRIKSERVEKPKELEGDVGTKGGPGVPGITKAEAEAAKKAEKEKADADKKAKADADKAEKEAAKQAKAAAKETPVKPLPTPTATETPAGTETKPDVGNFI